MSTPIDVVRHYIGSQQFVDEMFMVSDAGRDKLHAALATVLRDAERFSVVAEAHENPASDYCFCQLVIVDFISLNEPLADLADRLRSEGTK